MATVQPLPVPPDDGRAAFIAAIRATPLDDAPRLVYADWLDEQGDSDRATFIRLQVERAREPRGSDRLTSLDRQLKTLQRRVEKAVFQGLPRNWRAGASFERGFIERLNTTTTQFLRGGAALLAREYVRELALNSPNEPDFAAFLEAPELGNIVRLTISHGHLGNEGAFQLAACANLRHVRELDLGANYILTDGVRSLAESPHLTSLEHLTLKYNDAFAEGARAIAASKSLRGLKYLDIGCNEIGPDGLKALLKAPFAKQLTGLHIEGNPGYEPLLRTDGMQLLARTRALPSLEDLDLDSNELGDAGCIVLSIAKHLKKLKRLDLQNNSISHRGVSALFRSGISIVDTLEELSLQSNNLEGLKATDVVDAVFPRLRQLDLGSCAIGPNQLAILAQSPLFATVEVLTLNYNPLGDKGIEALAMSPHLTNLAELNLTNCDIGNDGLKALAKANLPKLRHLWISYNAKCKSAGVQALAKAPWFGQLGTLSLGGFKFGKTAAAALARVRPMSNLYYMYCGDVTDADARAILKKRFKDAVSF